MKWNNEELSIIAEDSRINMQFAIDILAGVENYKEVAEILEEAMEKLNDIAEPYEKAYEKEQADENAYLMNEYRRSVI